MNKPVEILKIRKKAIIERLFAFNRRFVYREPTAAELAIFEAEKTAVQAINREIERQEGPRTLTRADIESQLASILREEQEALRQESRRR